MFSVIENSPRFTRFYSKYPEHIPRALSGTPTSDVPVLFIKKVTRRDRLKSAPYLRLKNIQRTTIGNIWKNYFFFKNFFFEKKYFFSKSHNAEKLKKRPFRLIKRFYKPKTSKKCKGLPFDRIRKFSKKKSHSAEKKPKGGTLWSHLLYFWKHKNIMV